MKQVRLAVALVLAALSTGCPKKASYMPNGHGGCTLMTTARAVEQAATRFRRSAEELCGPSYAMGEPSIMAQGWSVSGWTAGGSDLAMRVDVQCGTAQSLAERDPR